MDDLISTSTALFQTTTGFSFSDLVDWAGDILVTILGMGLGLVDAMLPWVLAIIVISVIVGLIYRGLRWLHIIR
jgi:uncharacterized membrane protein (DUF106 family)